MKFSVFQVSRKGGRATNQDRMGYCYTRDAGLFLLADGLGGHPEGDVASQMALQVMTVMFHTQSKTRISDVGAFLSASVQAANRQILRYAAEKSMIDSPRTTLVAALIQDGCISWVHCGDSRLYHVRAGELLTRTRDHSYLEQRQGELPFAKKGEKFNRNVLFTCLGSPTAPVFDLAGPIALEEGDKILLCSDGLWGSLNDVDIVRELGQHPVSVAVPSLVDKALKKAGDGSDNVTVIALEWEMPNVFESSRGSISTESIEEGVFASTMHASGLDVLAPDMDDAEIERSIAEINAAIRRTSAKNK